MKKVILKCKLENRDRFEDKLSDIDLDFSNIFPIFAAETRKNNGKETKIFGRKTYR